MIHLIPVNDLVIHEENTTCDCQPKVEFLESGDMMVTHNSYDGRELLEIDNSIIIRA